MMSELPDVTPVDPHLRTAVLEIESHAAEAGWDQPARLFALVPTADLPRWVEGERERWSRLAREARLTVD